MTKSPPHLVTISYAKRTLEPGSREQQRMQDYAAARPGQYVMIVFTRRTDALPERYEQGNLTILGTHTFTRLGALVRAYTLARRYVTPQTADAWLLSTQDPFETSLPGRLLVWRTGVRHHVQLHGDQFLNKQWRRASWFNRFRVWFGLRVVRQACGVRTVSARAKRALVTLGVPEQRIVVLPIQSQLEAFLAVGRARRYAPLPTTTFLYVGRFSPEKNVDQIVAAFALAYPNNPTYRLTLLGAGVGENALRKQIAAAELQGVVSITSWTNNVAGVMAEADVLLLASAHEGYAMVIPEAMAAGLPVISTDVGCVGEYFIPNQHGLVVPFNDPNTMAEGMIRLSDETLRAEYGRAGHQAATAATQSNAEYIEAWKASLASCDGAVY